MKGSKNNKLIDSDNNNEKYNNLVENVFKDLIRENKNINKKENNKLEDKDKKDMNKYSKFVTKVANDFKIK